MSLDVLVRKAESKDIDGIFRLLELYAKDGIVLRRSKEDIAFYLKNFSVAERSGSDGRIIGCAAARDFGNGLFEVRSLAVDDACQGLGVGRRLVESIIAALRANQPGSRLFALTYKPGFFQKLGFDIVDRDLFPEKIWSDCVNCKKKDCCDETAVLLNI